MEQNEILILHGTDYAAMANQLLRAADVAARIGDRRCLVALKPNLVVDAPASGGATTHPELVAGTIEYLHENGVQNLRVMESSWVGCRTAEACEANGPRAVCGRYGGSVRRFAAGHEPYL